MFADSFFENGQAIHGCGWAVTSKGEETMRVKVWSV